MSEIQKMGDEFLKAHRTEFEARFKSIGPDDYANISYTSGTTADPKGILLTTATTRPMWSRAIPSFLLTRGM